MTTKELVKIMSDSKHKMMKQEQLQEIIKKNLEVKEYISFFEKRNLVESVVNDCVLYKNGMFKINDIDKYVCFTMRAIEAYTNLELDDNLEMEYDTLCESKVLELIINAFEKEYNDLNILLQMQCDYVLSDNSIGSQFGKFLDEVMDRIDTLANILENKVNGFDFDNLPINTEDLNKLIQFVNMQK